MEERLVTQLTASCVIEDGVKIQSAEIVTTDQIGNETVLAERKTTHVDSEEVQGIQQNEKVARKIGKVNVLY